MRNFDYPMPYQGKMAKSALYHAARDANALRGVLRDGDAIPQWVHYKIAVAADNLAKVNRYMQYQVLQHPTGYARSNPQSDEKHVARAIKRVTPRLKKALKSEQIVARKAARLLYNLLQINPMETEDLLIHSLAQLNEGATGGAPDSQVAVLTKATSAALKEWQKALERAA